MKKLAGIGVGTLMLAPAFAGNARAGIDADPGATDFKVSATVGYATSPPPPKGQEGGNEGIKRVKAEMLFSLDQEAVPGEESSATELTRVRLCLPPGNPNTPPDPCKPVLITTVAADSVSARAAGLAAAVGYLAGESSETIAAGITAGFGANDGRPTLFTLNFHGLGIFKLAPDKAQAVAGITANALALDTSDEVGQELRLFSAATGALGVSPSCGLPQPLPLPNPQLK